MIAASSGRSTANPSGRIHNELRRRSCIAELVNEAGAGRFFERRRQ